MYININNKEYPLTRQTIIARHPGISFPVNIPESTFNELGYYSVTPVNPPVCNRYEVAEEITPICVDNIWIQKYRVRPCVESEIDDLAANIRAERNARLTACDWTQTPDSPVDSAAWREYRTALRNITQQSDFPFSVEWPVEPV
jgi:hypothetical protein